MTDYDFRTLSPIDFEIFVRDLLNEHMSMSLVNFSPGPDGGVDLRDVDSSNRVTIVQCKHRPDLTGAALSAALRREAAGRTFEVHRYILATTAALSPKAESSAVDALQPLPVLPQDIIHRGRLNKILVDHPDIERRHFKLWLTSSSALERLGRGGEWQRSQELLTRVLARGPFFVDVPVFHEAQRILGEKHYVVLTGAPGVGKSTVAEMLLLEAAVEGWQIIDVGVDIEEAWRALNGSKEKQVFFYDDFLGQSHAAEVGANEAARISTFIDRVRRGDGRSRLVMTSRDQVLETARNGADDRLRRLDVDAARGRVTISSLSRQHRALILFNHLHFSDMSDEDRAVAAVDTRHLKVLDHASFNPRILESVLVRGERHQSYEERYQRLIRSLDHPEELWAGSYQQLSPLGAFIVRTLGTYPDYAVPLDQVRAACERSLAPSSVDLARDWVPTLKVLEGTWCRLSAPRGSRAVSEVSLFDASRRDYLLGLLTDRYALITALDEAHSIDQLVHLCRLGGLIKPFAVARAHVIAPTVVISTDGKVIGEHLTAGVDRLHAAAIRCAGQELAGFDAVSKGRTPGRDHDWGREYKVLLGATSVLAVGGATEAELDWLQSNLGKAVAALDTIHPWRVESADAFELGARVHLLPDNVTDRVDLARSFVQLGLDAMSSNDDLVVFERLPEAVKDLVPSDELADVLLEYLELEVDGLKQQTDADVIDSWIDEIESTADRYNLSIDVQGLREWAAEQVHDDRRDFSRSKRVEGTRVEEADSDEHILSIFRSLG